MLHTGHAAGRCTFAQPVLQFRLVHNTGQNGVLLKQVIAKACAGCCCRLQCGEGAVQERAVHSLGCGRPGEAAAAVEALLQQHRRPHLRGRQPG